MNTSLPKAVVVTHGDVDGMICAAQLIRLEQSHCELLFSNARWIASKLRTLVGRTPAPQRVYVTDIPANEEALPVVESLTGRGVSVWWVDHHPWPEGLEKRMLSACTKVTYRDSTATPAGVLLSEVLAEKDPYYARLGRLCYAYERGTDWERDWFRLLASRVGKADMPILERLAFDRPFTPEDLVAIRSQESADRTRDGILATAPSVLPTAKALRLAVYDTSAKPGIFLGRQVFVHHDVDYCLIRVSERKWQLASRPAGGLSLAALLGKHSISGLEVAVGGRPDRLLAVTVAPHCELPKDAHEIMVSWVADRL